MLVIVEDLDVEVIDVMLLVLLAVEEVELFDPVTEDVVLEREVEEAIKIRNYQYKYRQ